MMKMACGNNSEMVITQFNKAHIASPGWPNPYPPNIHCKWKITATKGAEIELSLKGHKLHRKYVYIYLKYDIKFK